LKLSCGFSDFDFIEA
jgi:hypothetical protein